MVILCLLFRTIEVSFFQFVPSSIGTMRHANLHVVQDLAVFTRLNTNFMGGFEDQPITIESTFYSAALHALFILTVKRCT